MYGSSNDEAKLWLESVTADMYTAFNRSNFQQEIFELTPTAEAPDILVSPFGHDGFLVEVESVGAIIRRALARAGG